MQLSPLLCCSEILWLETSGLALSQLAWAHARAVDIRPRRRPPRAAQVKLLDLGLPFASKANVVAYERHVLFTSDDPTGAARHRAPCPISTTRIEEAFVHKMPEQLVGLVFAQAMFSSPIRAGERIGSTSRREMSSPMRMHNVIQ